MSLRLPVIAAALAFGAVWAPAEVRACGSGSHYRMPLPDGIRVALPGEDQSGQADPGEPQTAPQQQDDTAPEDSQPRPPCGRNGARCAPAAPAPVTAPASASSAAEQWLCVSPLQRPAGADGEDLWRDTTSIQFAHHSRQIFHPPRPAV
jgi:hypothetical protein